MPVTTSLRLRAAALTLAVAAVASVSGIAAVPAQAASAKDPCASLYNVYQSDKAAADAYYGIYENSTGKARTKAHDLYVEYRNKSQRDLAAYNTCRHH